MSKMQPRDTSSNNILKDRAVKFRCLPSVKSEAHAQKSKNRRGVRMVVVVVGGRGVEGGWRHR